MTTLDVLQARRTLSRLKRGVPPADKVEQIAVGMQRIQSRLDGLLDAEASPRWLGFQGEYGEGKSFTQALALQRALAAGYAVASLEVNKDDGALHQPQRHLYVMLESLRSPLPVFAGHQGLSEIFRHWLEVTPAAQTVDVLDQAQAVSPWSPPGRDPDVLNRWVRCLEAGPQPQSSHRVTSHGNSSGQPSVVWDRDGNAYTQAPLTRSVHIRRSGHQAWEFFATPEKWPTIRAALSGNVQSSQADRSTGAHPSYFSEFISFVSAQDLFRRSGYARFAAGYRLQFVLEWLRATGHQGLFLFIDEVDNVLRQIHGKAHPACFRTLAWYCSCPALQNLRVVFAGTPEIFDALDHGGRAQYAESLRSQETVREEEVRVYERWKREADRQAAEGWEKCATLRHAQRITLFNRIAEIHKVAWGTAVDLGSIDLPALAKRHEFDTTRRWVRATVQLLDMLYQKQYPAGVSRCNGDADSGDHHDGIRLPQTAVADQRPASPEPTIVAESTCSLPIPSVNGDLPSERQKRSGR